MTSTAALPKVADIIDGHAVFHDDMPVWEGIFGEECWPFFKPDSPFFRGHLTSSISWRDFVDGRGHTHPNSIARSKYAFCLTPEIVYDLKIVAVIYGQFPKLIKHSHARKDGQLAPITVKARIDILAKILSIAIITGKKKYNLDIKRTSDIPFSLLKEVIPTYSGRPQELKRALKLLSDPMVQRNLSAPLQWGQPDIEQSSIAWPQSSDIVGTPTLLDTQFLFLLTHCIAAIAKFMAAAGLVAHDSECRALSELSDWYKKPKAARAIDAYYKNGRLDNPTFSNKYGYSRREIRELIGDAHISAMVLVLLLTGIRRSETQFFMRDCLAEEFGYHFFRSKVVKHRPRDTPISEGWLAIDLTKDAYDVLMFVTKKTGCPHLFSAPWRKEKDVAKLHAYRPASLNLIIIRWLERIDIDEFFLGWTFSVHQLRETLVSQLAKQQVGLPFISMQLKHFNSRFNSMPNAVTAGYGQYRKQLMTSVSNRLALEREAALFDVYGEDAKFAGGGAAEHKARIDTFFSGTGLYGKDRERYIKEMAQRGVKLMPTSIGHCAKNFLVATTDAPPPCYGDYHCDPNCTSHVITARSAEVLIMRREFAHNEALCETNSDYKVIWLGLANELDKHIRSLR
ncbi:hypothetical protein [Paraburkholderia sp. JHI869]|uniref:hypothetical protein n=1 Tax=Paraburkholderia sp. JHI869 TaxID=3112959 RepID=UPI0031805026